MSIKEYIDLKAWQESHKIVITTYQITNKFPSREKFSLVDQMRRAAISVTSNIAEGFGRNSKKDKQHFFAMAKGSLLELENQYRLAKDLEYLQESQLKELLPCIQLSARLIPGLIKGAISRPSF